MVLPIEITPADVKRHIDAGEELTLIDIREPDEHSVSSIQGVSLIPMRDIPRQFDRLEELPVPLVLFCHHGVRSLTAVEWLREQGLVDCQSMSGGIDQWSRDIDTNVPRY